MSASNLGLEATIISESAEERRRCLERITEAQAGLDARKAKVVAAKQENDRQERLKKLEEEKEAESTSFTLPTSPAISSEEEHRSRHLKGIKEAQAKLDSYKAKGEAAKQENDRQERLKKFEEEKQAESTSFTLPTSPAQMSREEEHRSHHLKGIEEALAKLDI